jgi:hypothetical protein
MFLDSWAAAQMLMMNPIATSYQLLSPRRILEAAHRLGVLGGER